MFVAVDRPHQRRQFIFVLGLRQTTGLKLVMTAFWPGWSKNKLICKGGVDFSQLKKPCLPLGFRVAIVSLLCSFSDFNTHASLISALGSEKVKRKRQVVELFGLKFTLFWFAV